MKKSIKKDYLVISGKHAGKHGKLVSDPWIGNLWNIRMELNINGREWINIWCWEVTAC